MTTTEHAQTDCEIRELRHEEHEQVLAFVNERVEVVDPSKLRRRLSVVARQADGTLTGALLCLSAGKGSIAMELAVSEQMTDPSALGRSLIDKALQKLRCEDVHRCSVRTASQQSALDLWHAARWIDPTSSDPSKAA